jgi:hypothetical protein
VLSLKHVAFQGKKVHRNFNQFPHITQSRKRDFVLENMFLQVNQFFPPHGPHTSPLKRKTIHISENKHMGGKTMQNKKSFKSF